MATLVEARCEGGHEWPAEQHQATRDEPGYLEPDECPECQRPAIETAPDEPDYEAIHEARMLAGSDDPYTEQAERGVAWHYGFDGELP